MSRTTSKARTTGSGEERVALVRYRPDVYERRHGGVTTTTRTWDPAVRRLRTVRGWIGRRPT